MTTEPNNTNDPIRVLVVEDEPIIRWSIAESLREDGFDVLEASQAREAKTLMDEPDHVDAVFTDVQMPGGPDGLELASWLHLEHPEVAVLVTSGNVQSRAQPDNPAAESIVKKPYDEDDVAAQIKELVSEKRKSAAVDIP